MKKKNHLCEIPEVSLQEEEEQQERGFKDQMILNVFARPRFPSGGRRRHPSRPKQGSTMGDFYTYETPLDFSGRRDTCMSKTSFATALAGLLVTAESLQDHHRRRGAKKNPRMDRHTVERALDWLGIKIMKNYHASTTTLSWNMWDFHVHVNTIFPELLEDHHLRDSTTCSSPGPYVLPCASRLVQIVMESLHNAEISKDMMMHPTGCTSSTTKKNRHHDAMELVPGVWVQGPLWTSAPVLTTMKKKKDISPLPHVSADDKMDEDDAFYTFSFFKRGILEQHEIFYSISSDEEEGSKSSDESCSSMGVREEGDLSMMEMTTTPCFISCLSNTHCGIM